MMTIKGRPETDDMKMRNTFVAYIQINQRVDHLWFDSGTKIKYVQLRVCTLDANDDRDEVGIDVGDENAQDYSHYYEINNGNSKSRMPIMLIMDPI